MNRILLFISLSFSVVFTYAQNEVDALRYSNPNSYGTARFVSLGGAMGALGADVTTMSYNPAGIGVYRSNTMVFTPAWTTTTSKTKYHGTNSSDRVSNNLHLANIGFVSVNAQNNDYGLSFFNFGISYNQLANYNQDFYISGQNTVSSFLDPETEALATSGNFNDNNFYYTYLIDPIANGAVNKYDGNNYGSFQTKHVQTNGYAGEYSLNIATNFSDKFYAGLTLGLVHAFYQEKYSYSETPNSLPNLQYFDTQMKYTDRGNGVNLKLGVINRTTPWLRLGIAVHTPTFYSFKESFEEDVYSEFLVSPDEQTENTTFSSGKFNDRIYYDLVSPFKAIFSAAFIYKKYGLLSVDYEYIDYSKMHLQLDDESYNDQINNVISGLYTSSSNIRVGGEYTYGPFAARLGFAFYQSPYTSDYKNSEAHTYIYSGGLGLRTNEFFVDLAVKYSLRNEYHNLYNSPTDAFANLDYEQLSYVFSLGFKF